MKNKINYKEFGVGFWITLFILSLFVINIPSFIYLAGKNCFDRQNYQSAYNLLKKAYFLKPQNRDIRYCYVKTMTKLKPIEPIQVEMFKITQGKEDDAAQKLAILEVNYWKNNVLNNIGRNYIEQTPFDRNIVRWDPETFPLRVNVEVPISIPDYYKEEIEKAFSEWEKRTEFIQFELTEDKNAQIFIKFEPLPEDICIDGACKYVVAYTTPDIKGAKLRSMTIIMYDTDANGNYFSDKEIYNTILHEIGHALGIMGHSYSSDDLMFMSTMPEFNITRYRSGFQNLSQEDLNTIKLLYKLVPNISNSPVSKMNKNGLIYAPIILGNEIDINNRKIKEAQNYIQSAPEISGGYVDLGVAYADIGKYNEAIAALREGLSHAKTDNDKYIIYYNIAVIYMNTNKLDEAETYIRLAQDVNDNENIEELITNLNHARATNKKPFKINTAK